MLSVARNSQYVVSGQARVQSSPHADHPGRSVDSEVAALIHGVLDLGVESFVTVRGV